MGNMNLVTGYLNQAHVTSADDGRFNALIVGKDKYVFDIGNKFATELISNNKIKVLDGDMIINGRYARLESAIELNIDNGSQSLSRYDLVVARYEKNEANGIESVNVVIVKGSAASTPQDPQINDTNILDNPLKCDFPLYRITINGLNVEKIEPLFDIYTNGGGKVLFDGTATGNVALNDSVDKYRCVDIQFENYGRNHIRVYSDDISLVGMAFQLSSVMATSTTMQINLQVCDFSSDGKSITRRTQYYRNINSNNISGGTQSPSNITIKKVIGYR